MLKLLKLGLDIVGTIGDVQGFAELPFMIKEEGLVYWIITLIVFEVFLLAYLLISARMYFRLKAKFASSKDNEVITYNNLNQLYYKYYRQCELSTYQLVFFVLVLGCIAVIIISLVIQGVIILLAF